MNHVKGEIKINEKFQAKILGNREASIRDENWGKPGIGGARF